MPQQNGNYNPVNNHIDRRHERTITVGDYTIDLYYPGTTRELSKETWKSDNAKIRIVSEPPAGWEADLVSSIQSLRRSKNIGDIYGYLPGGTYIKYQPYQSERDKIPDEIGIAEEIIGPNLERLVRGIELWLKKKSNSK